MASLMLINQRTCDLCSRKFSCRQSLYRHKRNFHQGDNPQVLSGSNGTITCPMCAADLDSQISLCNHVENVHRVKATVNTIDFVSQEEFMAWRKQVETAGNFRFVVHGGMRKTDKSRTKYLYCYRSGVYVSNSKGVKASKLGVTNKINHNCTAFAKIFYLDNVVRVVTCLDHCGHDDDWYRMQVKLKRQRRSGDGKRANGIAGEARATANRIARKRAKHGEDWIAQEHFADQRLINAANLSEPQHYVDIQPGREDHAGPGGSQHSDEQNQQQQQQLQIFPENVMEAASMLWNQVVSKGVHDMETAEQIFRKMQEIVELCEQQSSPNSVEHISSTSEELIIAKVVPSSNVIIDSQEHFIPGLTYEPMPAKVSHEENNVGEANSSNNSNGWCSNKKSAIIIKI